MIEIDCPCGENHKYKKDIYLTTENPEVIPLFCEVCGDKVDLKISFTVNIKGANSEKS